VATVNGDILKKLARVGFCVLSRHGVQALDVARYVDCCEREFSLTQDERRTLLETLSQLNSGGSK